MRQLRAELAVGLALACVLSQTGCRATLYHDFIYVPQALAQAQPTDFKIAVIPFEDGRQTYDKGSHAWAYLPLVLWATERQDTHQSLNDRSGSNYYYPELIPYTLALDLVANDVSKRVDIAPAALEDYDLIIHGVLHSTERSDRRLPYGLGFMSWITNFIVLPQGVKKVQLDATYSVYSASGERLSQQRILKEWNPFYWAGEQWPKMQGPVETIQAANQEFLGSLLAMLNGPQFQPSRDALDRRIRLYHARLDPELPQLVTERERVRGQDSGYARALQKEIRERATNLEKYRRAEQLIISKQQEYIYNSQYQRVTQIAQVRAARRQAIAQQQAAQKAHDQAVGESLAGAMAAGLLPAVGAMNSTGGHWTSEIASQMAQDMSAALAAMPPAPPPPPDLSRAIAKIDFDTEGLEAPSAVLKGLRGNNLAEIRGEFLRRYAKTLRSLAQIQSDYGER